MDVFACFSTNTRHTSCRQHLTLMPLSQHAGQMLSKDGVKKIKLVIGMKLACSLNKQIFLMLFDFSKNKVPEATKPTQGNSQNSF